MSEQLFARVNKFLGRENTQFQSFVGIIEDLLNSAEQFEIENVAMAEKHAEKDIAIAQFMQIVDQQREEIKQYQLQEKLLIERLKKVESKSSFMKYMAMAEENLRLAQENALLKAQ